MRRICLLLIITTLLISCTTTKTYSVNYSKDQASYALAYALDTAITKSLSKTSVYLTSKERFIPSEYSVLEAERDNIAGLDTLLEQWTTYAYSYVNSEKLSFELYIKYLEENFEIQNPIDTVLKGNTSASDQFLTENSNTIFTELTAYLSNLDTSYISQAVRQYNLWIEAWDFVNGSTTPKLIETDVRSSMAKLIFEHFCRYLTESEELFRTTPSSDSDPTVAKVFDLN